MKIFKFSHSRFMPWLAITSATLSIAIPAFAQQGDSLPTRPANWPDFPPPTTSSAIPPIRADAVGTTMNLPPFSGFGLGSGAPSPSTPQGPNTSLAMAQGYSDNGSVKVWNVSGADGSAPPQSQNSMERSPSQFGSGWRNFVNQKVLGREDPAAVISAPQTASGPRPEWSWHGYDNYDQGRPTEIDHGVQTSSAPSSADMAPFMKYAHLWRPSNLNLPVGAAQGLAQSNPAATATTDPTVFMPPPAPMAPIATIPRIPPLTPAVTVPIDETGRPSLIQPTDYRTTTQFNNPLPPPVQAPPAKPRVIYTQAQPESPNSVPLAVRERLIEMCSGKCRNLAVELASSMHLRIAFMVRDQVEADMLTNLLGGISELAPYKVDFEVQIGQ